MYFGGSEQALIDTFAVRPMPRQFALNNSADLYGHTPFGVGAAGGVRRNSVQSLSIPCKSHRGRHGTEAGWHR